MIKALRQIPPPLWLAGMALIGFMLILSALPFVQLDRVLPPVVIATPTPVAPKPVCLQRLAPFHHFSLPVSPEEWGPGKEVKHGPYDFGASAVPQAIDRLTPAEAMAAVKYTYIKAICGDPDKNRGGDPKILQAGLLSLQSSYNPNEPLAHDWDLWALSVEAYLGMIDWDASYLEQKTMPEGMVTLTMRSAGSPEPTIYAVATQQPHSWYLVLAFKQADGGVRYATDSKRLECFFQSTYKSREDVPTGVSFTR